MTGPRKGDAVFLVPLAVLVLVLLAPIAVMLFLSAGHGMLAAFFDGRFLESVALTVAGATVASALAVVLGTPASYAMARGLVKGRVRLVSEALLLSPMTVPHVIAGIAILITFAPISPLHPLLGGVDVFQTFAGLTLAYFFVSVPIYVSAITQSLAQLDGRLELAARSLGASRPRVFLRVVVPNIRSPIVESFILTWARAMSEFGSILILAYLVVSPPFYYVQPAPVYVWNAYEVGGLFSALKYAGALLLISIATLVALEWVRSRR
ncbi:MAG: ABC transporter permease [Nitrososphaerota archaeon]|nr:ABC transporter permease [Nitrososphaerota archaeon]MDG6939811.1 ABC transporter permease [Nitrososphaerota archaeon]